MVDFAQGPFFGPGGAPFSQEQALQAVAPPAPPFLTGPTGGPQVNPAAGQPTLPPGPPPAPVSPPGGGMPGMPAPSPAGAPGGVGAFLGAPGMAMANTALNNIMAMRRGHAPTANPAMVYGQERRRNQALQERKLQNIEQRRQARLRENLVALQTQKAEQDLDPFFAYKKAIDDNLISPDVSLAEFNRMGASLMDPGSHAKTMALWEEANPPPNGNRNDPAWRARYAQTLERVIRPLQIVDTGGGGKAGLGLTGGPQPIVDPTRATELDAAQAAAVKTAQDWAAINTKFSQDLQTRVPALSSRYKDLKRAVEIIDSNEGDFGPAASLLGDIYNPANAEINAIAMTGLLQTLSEVTTGALSQGEIEIFSRDLATSDKSPASNRALLNRAMEMIERAMTSLEAKGNYFINNQGSLEGWDAQQLESLRRVVTGIRGESDDPNLHTIPGAE